jgi:hypothetical protein
MRPIPADNPRRDTSDVSGATAGDGDAIEVRLREAAVDGVMPRLSAPRCDPPLRSGRWPAVTVTAVAVP